MASKRHDELNPAEKDLLGAYRASLSPAPARKAKAWATLGSLAKTGAGTAAAGTTKLILLSALTAATALGGVGSWVAAEGATAGPSAIPAVPAKEESGAQPAPRARGKERPQEKRRSPQPVQAVPVGPPAHPVEKSPTSRPRTSAVSTPRRLDAEARSLETMRSALSAGRNARVLSLIRAHRQEFQRAVFAEEVDALEVMASCRRSPDASAQKRLTAFGTRYPASPQTPALERACEPATVPVQRPSTADPLKQKK